MNQVASLGDVIEVVGVLDVLVAPRGIDVPLGEVHIHDPEEAWVATTGDVVLAVGVDLHRLAASDIVERASASGVAAVVFKLRSREAIDAVIDKARAGDVALLGAPPDLAWAQLHSLIRTAAAAAGITDEGPGGVPMGDLFALANAIAAMVGGPVTIEDPRSVVLAYSSFAEHDLDEGRRATILGHRVPDEWIRRQQEDGVFRRLYRERGVIRTDYAEFGLKPRLATAIRAGDEILGSIWVQEGDRPLDDDIEVALEESARIAALHLLRHRSGADLERTRRAELLRGALDGRVAPETLASVLDLAPAGAVTVIAVQLVDPAIDDAAGLAVVADRAAGLIALYCESYRRNAAVVAIGFTVYVLVADADSLTTLASGICERVHDALRVDVRAAIGGTVGSVRDLLDSRVEADRVLRAMATSPEAPNVGSADTVRARVVLDVVREFAAQEPTLSSGKLEVLLEHDLRKGTEYIATLRAFFAALGDMPAAAAAQGVHPNTFRYRMRRLAETANLDLDDPIERLVLHLQLELLA